MPVRTKLESAERSANGWSRETGVAETESPLVGRHDAELDPRTVLALQKLSGNAAVSRLVQQANARAAARNGTGRELRDAQSKRGVARFLDVRKLLEGQKKPRSFFEKAFDFARGLGKRVAGGGRSLFERIKQFTQGVGKGVGKVGAGAKSVFGKAFGAVTGGAKKAWGAAKAAAGKVGAGAKAVGGKVAAGAKKAASAPKGFFQMVLSWARKFLGLDAKETEAALAEDDEAGPGHGKKGKAGAAGTKGAKGKAAKGGAGGQAGGRRQGEDEPEAAGAGASTEPVSAGPAADGAATERPKSPEQDPRFQAFKGQVQSTAQKTKAHAPASAKAAEAQGAAKGPPNEVASQAKGAQVEEMAAQKPGTFDKKAFMDAVRKAIEAASPKNLKEATEFSESGKAGEVKDKVAGMVTQNKEAAEQGIKEKTEAEPDASKGEPKEVVPMADEKAGPKPPPVGAANAMPPPATAAEVDLSQGPKDIEQEMASNDVTEEQLRNSNEPEMIQAADAKTEAEKHSAEAPKEYRAQEATILEGARGEAQQQADSKVQGMHGSRVGALMQVAGAKGKTKTADEMKRAKVASDMEAIYGKTKTDVTKILDGIEPKVVSTFEAGEAQARQAFERYVDVEVSAYKKRRYSGWRGKLRWVRDKFRGLPGEVNKYYETGKNQYLAAMDGVIGNVAEIVATNLNAAKARIAAGQAETKKYVDGLPKDLKRIGKEAAENMGDKFAQLDDEVNSKSDELVQTIAGKYVESRDALDSRIEELKAANRGLIDRAIDAVKGVVKTIIALKDLMMTVLRKAISVIGDILAHPIRFIENFMSGVKAGLNLFVDRIEDYLKQALIRWLFGPSILGGAKIDAPKDLSPKSVLSIVLQVLGLSKDAILDLLRKKVGAPAVAKLQSSVQWISMLVSEGPAGLWNFVSDKVGDLYETVVGGIMDFLKNRVIRAGIMWLISLLNPAGALVRIVKAIVDVVTFIFERASQIGEFINAILDAVIAVAKGQTGGVAQKIADALGRGLELAIGLLASLLGISGIAQTVRGIIDKVRAPIKRVMNRLIDGAVRMAKKVFGRPARWVKKQYERGRKKVRELADKGKALAQKGVAWALGKLGFARFNAPGESHEVYAEMAGASAEVKVASNTPKDPKKFLDDVWEARIEPLPAGQKKQDVVDAWNVAKRSAGEVPEAVAKLAKVPSVPKKGTPAKAIQARLEGLALDLQKLMDAVARGQGEIATGDNANDPIPIAWFKKPSDYKAEIFLPGYDGGKGKAFSMRGVEDLFVKADWEEDDVEPEEHADPAERRRRRKRPGRASLGTWREDEIDVGAAGGTEAVKERFDIDKKRREEVLKERRERKKQKRPPKRDELHRMFNLAGLSIKMGVADKWMPDVLHAEQKVVERPVGADPRQDYDPQAMRQTKAAPLFKDILEAYGYEWEAPEQDPDHVHDLGFGGVDDLDAANMWPAPRTVNQREFTQVYSQTVVYLDKDGEVKRSTPAKLPGKFFKIVELR